MISSSLRRWPKLAGLCPGPIWRSFLAMTIHWSKSIWISLGRSGMWVLPTGLKKASSLFANNLYVKVKEINWTNQMFVSLRAYTRQFGDLIAIHGKETMNVTWLDLLFCIGKCDFINLGNMWPTKDPLPGPRVEQELDITAGDAELFRNTFLPLHGDDVKSIGDLWQDVPYLNIVSNKCCWTYRLHVPCLKAHIPSVLKYLAGCKYFKPQGRWVA